LHKEPILKRIAILISGRGSNMEAILRADLPAEFVAGVSDVGGSVDGDPAPVEPDVAGLPWHERLPSPGEGVREDERHGGYSWSSRSLARTE
jgi:hypothetical protein